MTETTRDGTKTTRLALVGWSCAIAMAIGVGLFAKAPPFALPPGAGRVFPRIPSPPGSLPSLLHALGVGSVLWYAVVVALPLLLWGARRLDPERRGRARTVIIAAAVLSALVMASLVVEFAVIFRGAPSRPSLAEYFPSALARHAIAWLAIGSIVAAAEWRRRALQSALERERLRAEVAEQRLIALTGQLQPHFLFNTLQGISTLIHRDPEAADEMLARLGDLLRDLLRDRGRVLVPLEDELRYARTYLELAQIRFSDRLTFAIMVPPELQQAAVPLFILQPLVENALTHGIGGRMRGGRITVAVSRRNGRLEIDVADDGAGLAAGAPPTERIGLGNTRERLRATFGADQSLTLLPVAGGGVVARLDIPYRTPAPPAAPS